MNRFFVAAAVLLFSASNALAASLPVDADWKETLRDHLATLTSADFEIADHEFSCPETYAESDDERVFRDWIAMRGREPSTAAFRANPEFFTLDSIEGEDAIRIFPEPAALAWWIQFDFPGNPYRGSEAGMKRAVVIAIVDMLMLETAHAVPYTIKPDFMGANLGTWAYTFQVCGGQLPDKVRAAYQSGMLHFLDLMERIAPRDGNTNMDMRELATLAELSHVFEDDPKIQSRLVRLARRILFGSPERGPATSDPRRGTFHPAGYIGEADGPETSYNGISLFHLAEAAMVSRGAIEWDEFMPEVVERMVRFRAFNTFPEPDGTVEGPSSWSTRTNDPYVRDQRDRPWRRYAEAMITDEALFRLGGLPTRGEMLKAIEQWVERMNRRPPNPEKWKADEAPVWAEHHWPNDLPYTWDRYVEGSYARFQQLLAKQPDLFDPPFARQGDFNLSFDDEFWMAKRGDWGFQVEAVPHMSRSYDKGGSGALAGGSLAAFWTRGTGVTVLGRLPDKWNYVTWDKIEQWPTHHLWGRTAEGSAFSTARQWHPTIHFERMEEGDVSKVHVFGMLGPKRTVEVEDSLDPGHVYYRREFELLEGGLLVRSEFLSRGEGELSELWETIPVFLNPTRPARDPETDTKIEFKIGGNWKAGEETADSEVEAVRLSRFEGSVVIEFESPQTVQLSEVITTEYQKKDRLRNLKIRLLEGDEKMPTKAGVTWLIRAE